MGYSVYTQTGTGLVASPTPSFAGLSNFTAAFYYKTTSNTTLQNILQWGDIGTGTPTLTIRITGAYLEFDYYSGPGSYHRWRQSAVWTTDQWVACVITHDFAGNLVCYIDGAAVAGSWVNGDGNASMWGSDNPFHVASSAGGTIGLLDQFAIGNVVKNATWVAQNYGATSSFRHRYANWTDATGMSYCWEFDEGTGATAQSSIITSELSDCTGLWSSDEPTYGTAPGPGDTPSVTITSPATGAVLGTNEITVTATVTDNDGIDTVTLYVQGQSQGAMTNVSGDTYQGTWTTSAWDNAAYTVEVIAVDTLANEGSDSITIDLQRSLANQIREIITRQLPVTDTAWNLSGYYVSKFIQSFNALYVDPDEGRNYLWQALIHVPGNTTDLTLYQLVERFKSWRMLDDGATFRLAWRATPFYVDATYATNSRTLAFPVLYTPEDGSETLAFWGVEEDRLYSFNGTTVSTLADIDVDMTDYTARALAYAEDAWWLAVESAVATQPHAVYRFDVDASAADSQFRLVMPDGDMVTGLATIGDDLYIGLNLGTGLGSIYRWDGSVLYLVDDSIEAVSTMLSGTGAVAIGTTDGKVYSTTSSATTLAYDTGEGADVDLLWFNDNVSYAAVGNKLFTNRSGSWALETTFTGETTLMGLAEFRERVWACFDSANLWRYDESDGWVLAHTIDDVDETGGLVSMGDGLIVLKWYDDPADAYAYSIAKLWRREIADQSAPNVQARYIGDIAVELLEVTPE